MQLMESQHETRKIFSKLITVAGYSSWKIDFAQESKNLAPQCHQSLGERNWGLDAKLIHSQFLENLCVFQMQPKSQYNFKENLYECK